MYTLYCLFMPWKNKKPLFLAIQNVMTSGFNSSTFFTQYVADVFTSLIKVFQDWAWTFCYILSGDFLKRSVRRRTLLAVSPNLFAVRPFPSPASTYD